LIEFESVVWPSIDGDIRGESIEPLIGTAAKASLFDAKFYELASLTEGVRNGSVKIRNEVINRLDVIFKEYLDEVLWGKVC